MLADSSLTTCSRADAGAWFNYPFLTQKERDNETGLDYFGARYYSSTQGRFTSADSFGGSGSNPQSLNLYSYSLNDPVNLSDPTGHFVERSEGGIKGSWNDDDRFEMKKLKWSQGPKQTPLGPTQGGPLGTPIEHPCTDGPDSGCNKVVKELSATKKKSQPERSCIITLDREASLSLGARGLLG